MFGSKLLPKLRVDELNPIISCQSSNSKLTIWKEQFLERASASWDFCVRLLPKSLLIDAIICASSLDLIWSPLIWCNLIRSHLLWSYSFRSYSVPSSGLICHICLCLFLDPSATDFRSNCPHTEVFHTSFLQFLKLFFLHGMTWWCSVAMTSGTMGSGDIRGFSMPHAMVQESITLGGPELVKVFLVKKHPCLVC